MDATVDATVDAGTAPPKTRCKADVATLTQREPTRYYCLAVHERQPLPRGNLLDEQLLCSTKKALFCDTDRQIGSSGGGGGGGGGGGSSEVFKRGHGLDNPHEAQPGKTMDKAQLASSTEPATAVPTPKGAIETSKKRTKAQQVKPRAKIVKAGRGAMMGMTGGKRSKLIERDRCQQCVKKATNKCSMGCCATHCADRFGMAIEEGHSPLQGCPVNAHRPKAVHKQHLRVSLAGWQ